MDRVRTLTAYSCFAAVIAHVVDILFNPLAPGMIILSLAFAVAFFAGGYLLLQGTLSPWVVGAVAFIALLLSIVGIVTAFNFMQLLFFLCDVAILAGCGYLLFGPRPASKPF